SRRARRRSRPGTVRACIRLGPDGGKSLVLPAPARPLLLLPAVEPGCGCCGVAVLPVRSRRKGGKRKTPKAGGFRPRLPGYCFVVPARAGTVLTLLSMVPRCCELKSKDAG